MDDIKKRRRRRHLRLLGSVALLAVLALVCTREPVRGILRRAAEAEFDPEAVTVEYVIDGDTLIVEQDGEEKKVRLVGVNTPESVSADASVNSSEGEQASQFAKAYLPPGTRVYLEYDEETQDRYGRTLAYVWLTNDCDHWDYEDFCKYNFGAILMQNTYCEAVYYKPNGRYYDWYRRLEEEYQDR